LEGIVSASLDEQIVHRFCTPSGAEGWTPDWNRATYDSIISTSLISASLDEQSVHRAEPRWTPDWNRATYNSIISASLDEQYVHRAHLGFAHLGFAR
jgi:hypothetical protein